MSDNKYGEEFSQGKAIVKGEAGILLLKIERADTIIAAEE